MRKEVLMLSAAIFLAGTSAVRAQSCATPPSCASLGYTMTTSACSGQPTLVCPFDSSAVFCAGSSSGSGSSSGGGLIDSCDGDCIVHWFNTGEGAIKVVYKYKFIDNVTNPSQCFTTCARNKMTLLRGSQFLFLCTEANKTSGRYYYNYNNGSVYSSGIVDCGTYAEESATSSNITGCLCGRIIG